jgi:hypothetical protein
MDQPLRKTKIVEGDGFRVEVSAYAPGARKDHGLGRRLRDPTGKKRPRTYL